MSFNIPKVPAKRVVVVGGGFGGLKLCSELVSDKNFQVVLIDKNNFHQFPPLIYQVATAGLQVSAITFPFRKLFAKHDNFFFRRCELRSVHAKERYIQTSIGKLDYDILVMATGTTTNYFGNARLERESMPMKTIDEALGLRNALLETFERANTCASQEEREELLNVVVVGGGPTGVEIAGALAEMREHVLPNDYPDLDTSLLKIHLLQGGNRLLPAMSKTASEASLRYLTNLGVDVQLNTRVNDYENHEVKLASGKTLRTQTIIWVCGVIARKVQGIAPEAYGQGNRLLVDRFSLVQGYNNIYAVGDCALMKTHAYPYGHPQMAQAAIQQGANLAKNLINKSKGHAMKTFYYNDLGSMATIGRNKAVADLFGMNLTGIFAWFLWMLVHLMSILGVKNKVATMLDWAWSYFSYDKSNRIIIGAKNPQIIVERQYEISKRHWGELSKEQATPEDLAKAALAKAVLKLNALNTTEVSVANTNANQELQGSKAELENLSLSSKTKTKSKTKASSAKKVTEGESSKVSQKADTQKSSITKKSKSSKLSS